MTHRRSTDKLNVEPGGETLRLLANKEVEATPKTKQSEFPTPAEVKVGQTVEAKIVGGSMKTGEEIFGEDARDPEQKRLVLDLSLGDGQETLERSLPWRDPAGPKTSLGKFKVRYGTFPRVGLTIMLSMGDNGWYIDGLD